ncbi:hypothetical protein F0562_017530 [Nyssa sinensis]|uniref:Retrovirus-related Pol polyprotein from transposon TNT 1-94-like beta-barrel domain-containing protein n=1 Tax=Nyssa sinensis TaxID=561372 RepID=A0A5J4ZI51_9ASTE|nr:hypothetical protein F0562_017530 [Nyssa sinensis]
MVRLLGSDLHDSRIVEKIPITVPEKFEATIMTLENTKDLSKITLAELLNALQAQEQRRVMRQGGVVKGALPVKHQEEGKMEKKKNKKNFATSGDATANNNKNKTEGTKGNHPLCQHCGRKGHPPFKCWGRPDAKCSKCNQLGHEAVICKGKSQQQEVEAQVVDQEELFKELENTTITKDRIGNGDHIVVNGKGTIAIESCLGTKTISDVLYVPEIDQNLLSVGQLIENGLKVIFEDRHCLIKDAAGQEMFKVRMRGKSFSLDPMEEKQAAFPISESTT